MPTNQEIRQKLYDTMTINKNIVDATGKVLVANVPAIVKSRTDLMKANMPRYDAIAKKFPNPGLKGWLIAIIHEMEASQSFKKHLHNGDPLTARTVQVPAGRPKTGTPPFTFEDSAVDALKLQGADKIIDWSMGNVLYFLEGFNGYGYAEFKKINSPYIWSGSSNYRAGKYVADSKYDKNAVSKQIGVALLIKSLLG